MTYGDTGINTNLVPGPGESNSTVYTVEARSEVGWQVETGWVGVSLALAVHSELQMLRG